MAGGSTMHWPIERRQTDNCVQPLCTVQVCIHLLSNRWRPPLFASADEVFEVSLEHTKPTFLHAGAWMPSLRPISAECRSKRPSDRLAINTAYGVCECVCLCVCSVIPAHKLDGDFLRLSKHKKMRRWAVRISGECVGIWGIGACANKAPAGAQFVLVVRWGHAANCSLPNNSPTYNALVYIYICIYNMLYMFILL